MTTTNGISAMVGGYHGEATNMASSTSSSGYFSSNSPQPRDTSSTSTSTHLTTQHEKRQKLKELVRPLFQESYFSAEYCLLGAVQINQPGKMSGLYAIPSAQSPFIWFGVLFVRNGYWQGGVFRFVLKFPDHFPDAAGHQNNLPAVHFTGGFPKNHPFINKGVFDIKRFHRTYNRTQNHIWQLLKCVRKIFYKFEVLEKTSYPNKSAAELYLRDEEQFKKKCESDVQSNLSRIYDEDSTYSSDANYIRFAKDFKKSESSGVVVDVVRNSGIGLSWMNSHPPTTTTLSSVNNTV